MVEQPWSSGRTSTAGRQNGRYPSGRMPERMSERPPERSRAERRGTARDGDSEKAARRSRRGGVLAVQCIACAVLVLLALLLRAAGGEAFAELRRRFNDGVARNELLSALAALWDGDPESAVSGVLREQNDGIADAPESSAPDSSTPSNDGGTSNDGETSSGGGTSGDSAAESSNVPSAAGTSPSAAQTAGFAPPAGAAAVALTVRGLPVPPLQSGTLTSGYGYRTDPLTGARAFHRGVDIAAPAGTPVAAMLFGRVAAVGESGSLGHFIRIDHGGGVEVLYAHCSRVLAAEGAVVRAGETVAFVGSTGRSTGAHLHVQVSAAGTVFGPGRLVPLTRYGGDAALDA